MKMEPTRFNNLSAEDAEMILELSPILNIVFAEPLKKGHERKFYIKTSKGEKRLLRINNIEHYDWIMADARWYEYVASAGINVMRLIGMGVFCDGTLSYQLFTWFDGEDLVEALPRMSHAEQFAVGVKCGAVSRKIHSLPLLYDAEPWGLRYKRKVQDKIHSYNDMPHKSREEDLLMRYLQDNMKLLDNRPHTTTHGDWNTENIILTPDGQIGVIDLGGGNNYNDPWWEFWAIPDDVNLLAHFYTGQIKGYFEGEPPAEYFPLLAYYIAFGKLEWEYDYQCVLKWFDNMQNPVPSWYLKDYNVTEECIYMSDYTFLLASNDDIPEIVSIYQSLVGTPGCTWDLDYPSRATAESDIASKTLYVLKMNDKIVAVASVGAFNELGHLKWTPKNPCELARIGVMPTMQKQGIGTMILQNIFNTVQEKGFDGIRMLVSKTNPAALALYDKNGFVKCGEEFKYDIDFYCYEILFNPVV